MQLTKNFTLAEFTESDTAERVGIDNTPSANALANLKKTAEGMQKVRDLLGKPISISSGYRSPALNRYIGGSSSSHHCFGYAVDFKSPSFGTPYEVTKAIIASDIKYDQIIWEGTWVHISFSPAMRMQKLTATFKNGKATYSEFK